MLQSLHVKNLALIDEAEVDFEKGLNILTGETGAGKSIIIGSVNLALGAKASKDLIRKGADYALIELVFSADSPKLLEGLREFDIYPEENELIMTRKIMPGRSVCRINGETVSASVMRTVASWLIDIHGQHEHQSLLTTGNHLKYLDAYGDGELKGPKELLAEAWNLYREKKSRLEETGTDREQRARELSFLQFEIDEIEKAELTPGEDEQLELEYKKLANSRKIMEAASEAYEITGGGRENASDMTGRALKELLSICEYDDTISELSEQLQEIDNLLSDFNRELSGYLSDTDFSEELFVRIQERLDVINRLKAKYGNTIEEILEQKAEKEVRIRQLLNFDEYRKNLEEECRQAEEKLRGLSDQVSGIRKKYADRMVKDMTKALKDLNFLEVVFEIRFKQLDHYGEKGTDEVRFYISTNPGEEPKPLEQIASGGELSRIMLALKTVLAEKDDIETLIFDEIDTGISGRTAQMVAEKMKVTGKNHQVICITHLPQIAAMADAHFLIEKKAEKGNTSSQIRKLKEKESIQELARMLGGVKITDTVLESAKEMKEMANSET